MKDDQSSRTSPALQAKLETALQREKADKAAEILKADRQVRSAKEDIQQAMRVSISADIAHAKAWEGLQRALGDFERAVNDRAVLLARESEEGS